MAHFQHKQLKISDFYSAYFNVKDVTVFIYVIKKMRFNLKPIKNQSIG